MKKSGLERMLESSTCILSDGNLYVLDDCRHFDGHLMHAKILGCSWPAFPAGDTLFYDRQFLLDNIAQADNEAEKELTQKSEAGNIWAGKADLSNEDALVQLAFAEGGLFSAPEVSGSLIGRKTGKIEKTATLEEGARQILSEAYDSGFFPKNYELFSSQGRIFSLRRDNPQDAAVEINGIKYTPEEALPNGKISEITWNFLEKKISDAAEPLKARRNSPTASEISAFFSELNSKGFFERDYFGIAKIGKTFYAYKWINSKREYALQHFWDNTGYLFPTARVACEISMSGKVLGMPKSEVIVIEKYRHPFLNNDAGMEPICMPKDIFSDEMNRCASNPQKYRRALLFGESVILSGYTYYGNMRPYHILDKDGIISEYFLTEYQDYSRLPPELRPAFSNAK